MKKVDGGDELVEMMMLLLVKISDRLMVMLERGVVGERINPPTTPFCPQSQHDSI